MRALRSLLHADHARLPIWVASWGSAAGLRRVAELGEGWLASAYNTTPAAFQRGLQALPAAFPHGIATMWLYVTDRRRDAERMLSEVLAPLLDRPVAALRDLELPIGPAEVCAERISAYAAAGAERVFLWPLTDELRQLERFREEVAPLIG